jgi:hypothetical protein
MRSWKQWLAACRVMSAGSCEHRTVVLRSSGIKTCVLGSGDRSAQSLPDLLLRTQQAQYIIKDMIAYVSNHTFSPLSVLQKEGMEYYTASTLFGSVT